jgi:hypothetical protein
MLGDTALARILPRKMTANMCDLERKLDLPRVSGCTVESDRSRSPECVEESPIVTMLKMLKNSDRFASCFALCYSISTKYSWIGVWKGAVTGQSLRFLLKPRCPTTSILMQRDRYKFIHCPLAGLLLWQSESDVGGSLRTLVVSLSAGRNNDVLLAVYHVCRRCCRTREGQLTFPK